MLNDERYTQRDLRPDETRRCRNPCSAQSPWRIIIYQDGVDPSDGLAANHSRKSCVFYWSFVEYGMHALCHEEVWGTLCVMRSHDCNKLSGNISQLFQKALELFFGSVHDIQRSGIRVLVNGCSRGLEREHYDRYHILAGVGVVFADEPALKEMLNCKGHAGTKPCLLCVNATLHNSRGSAMHTITDDAISVTNTNWRAFKKHSDASIQAVVRRVNALHAAFMAGTITGDAYELRTQMLGWTWTPANVLLNERFNLKVASTTMYDWAHCYVHDGLGDVEFGQLMRSLHQSRSTITYAKVGAYVDTFTMPKSYGKLDHLFKDAPNRNNLKKGSFTCTGSEFLTLVPILHRFFSKVALQVGHCQLHVESFVAVLHVIVLLQARCH